ncbi:DUF1190 family protein [Enterobacteriaceae bacterium ESL0689]|nr:DUF1190 family protein [Enterobacteriaceae bacterium ESL0689]
MKRTKNINHSAFRKYWGARHLTPVALAIAATFTLAGCEKSDETVSLYQNAEDCSAANPDKRAECTTAFNAAEQEAARTAPKYDTHEDCIAEFGEGQCRQEYQRHGGSIWMPLMAGYMMARMTGGGFGAQQPLFTSKTPTSPAYGQYTDASGRSYGAAQPGRTINVPKSAMAPKPTTTRTITRGGFGQSVTQQAAMQRHAASSKSSSRHSTGG